MDVHTYEIQLYSKHGDIFLKYYYSWQGLYGRTSGYDDLPGHSRSPPKLQRSSVSLIGILLWLLGVVGTMGPIIMNGGYYRPTLLREAGVVLKVLTHLMLA